MGLYFSRVYDTRRSLRCHSRGCDVIKTSGQHPSRSSNVYMRRNQGLCPSRFYDIRRKPAFILQEVKLGHRENISKKFKKLFFLQGC